MRTRSAHALLGAALVLSASLATTPEAHAAPTCFGKKATIVGQGDEDLRGTQRADVIVAGPGSVRVEGRGGNDRICLGGGGYDEAFGGSGRDRIDAGRGYDLKTVAGGPGDDFLYEEAGGGDIALFSGGPGDDEIRAGDGLKAVHESQDVLIGGPGDDVLLQGAGRSRIEGGSGNDVLSGGPDADTVMFSGAPGPVEVDLDSSVVTADGRDRVSGFEDLIGSRYDDVLRGTAASNTILGLGGDDVIEGEEGDDFLRGQNGADRLVGGGGDDLLEGGRHDDALDGGPDSDMVAFPFAAAPVTVDLAAETATGDGTDALREVENAMGSNLQGDMLLGDDDSNVLISGGRDALRGLGGDDVLESANMSELDGGDGSDTVLYRTSPVTVNLTTGTDSRGTILVAVENVTSTSVRIEAIGDEGPNRLEGAGLDDVLRGMGGDDVLLGRGGPDEIDGGLGDDEIDGGSGSDTCTNGEDVTACEG